MAKLSMGTLVGVVLISVFGSGVASGGRIADEPLSFEDADIENNPELALKQARRLFYDIDRTDAELGQARYYFGLAKDFIDSGHMRACEFWLIRADPDWDRAEGHCLRAVEHDEYHALMALAHIYERGPKGTRNPAHAYSCYLLVAQIKQGALYDFARAGQKRVGRELARAERRRIDDHAGAGWSLF